MPWITSDHDYANVLKLFRIYGSGHLRLFVVGFVMTVVTPAVAMLDMYLIGIAIDSIILESRPLPAYFPAVEIHSNSRLNGLFLLTGGLIAVYAAVTVLGIVGRIAWGDFSQKVLHDIRVDVYESSLSFSFDEIEERGIDHVLSIVNNDVNNLENFLSNWVGKVVPIIARGVVALALVFTIEPRLALLNALVVPVVFYVGYRFSNVSSEIYREVRASVEQINQNIRNGISGIDLIKVYGFRERSVERLEEASDRYLIENQRSIRATAKYRPLITAISMADYLAVLCIGGYLAITSTAVSVGELVILLGYSRIFTGQIRDSGSLVDPLTEAQASIDRIADLAETDRRRADGGEPIDGITDIVLDDVTYSYDSDDPAVDGVSLTLERGDAVGILGPSGAGKSTIGKLLVNLYPPDDGSLSYDGIDGTAMRNESLWDNVGYVRQDPFLFEGLSLEENIAMDDEYDRTDVEWAAEKARIDEFIDDCESGYESVLGEDVTDVSGGQKQRLALARALYKRPDLLVLDEATSSVDIHMQEQIYENVNDVLRDGIVVSIIHRKDVTNYTNRDLIMSDGRIVYQGGVDPSNTQLVEILEPTA